MEVKLVTLEEIRKAKTPSVEFELWDCYDNFADISNENSSIVWKSDFFNGKVSDLDDKQLASVFYKIRFMARETLKKTIQSLDSMGNSWMYADYKDKLESGELDEYYSGIAIYTHVAVEAYHRGLIKLVRKFN